MDKLRRICVLVCAVGMCAAVSSASAAFIGGLRVDMDSGSSWEASNSTIGTIEHFADGSTKVSGHLGDDLTSDWLGSWELLLGAGGVALSGNLNITSNVPFTDTFEVVVSLPSDVFLPAPTNVLGSVSINLSDSVSFGDGAELTTDGATSVYTAFLAGAEIDTLVDPDFSLVAPPFQTNSHGPENFSGVGPAVAIGDLLEIRHRFTLTAFDTAQVVSTFVITPEPSALVLVGIGATSAVFRLKRRRP